MVNSKKAVGKTACKPWVTLSSLLQKETKRTEEFAGLGMKTSDPVENDVETQNDDALDGEVGECLCQSL